jgi:hypothetical protein
MRPAEHCWLERPWLRGEPEPRTRRASTRRKSCSGRRCHTVVRHRPMVRSMRIWLGSMGLSIGGKTYRLAAEQARPGGAIDARTTTPGVLKYSDLSFLASYRGWSESAIHGHWNPWLLQAEARAGAGLARSALQQAKPSSVYHYRDTCIDPDQSRPHVGSALSDPATEQIGENDHDFPGI